MFGSLSNTLLIFSNIMLKTQNSFSWTHSEVNSTKKRLEVDNLYLCAGI